MLPTVIGKLLMALDEGGFQYLVAGARGNVGVKARSTLKASPCLQAGRYFFEVMIAEAEPLTRLFRAQSYS